ncbi:MAG TPA: carboxylating nicotinate-nucleotide diphosphorylase [Firmicutes bacterium]|nr:carboxylating nicotinate-nucleotide diphosphorylase [Bacillota bacterium]HBT16519.1 carboxylating nicotinate-nucleotide diphosphorylase [Bacillota bacterium]
MIALPKQVCTELVRIALAEDLGAGDITSELTIAKEATGTGRFISKASGVICGWTIVKEVFQQLNPGIFLDIYHPDGSTVAAGDLLAVISGPVKDLLGGERVALNFLQHLSGIASYTRKLVDLITDFPQVRVVDTRKTIPGLRIFQKYAVRIGGGYNHRFNLADAVLIKDNHLLACGGVQTAIKKVRAAIPHTMKIEVEVESEEQVREALKAGADIIMLDNMSPDLMTKMVKLINQQAIVEASGNITAENIRTIAACGVDIISVGSLTHSVQVLDISLKLTTD